MQNVKVTYSKEWGNNGTCYRKGYTFTKQIFISLLGMLEAEEAMEKDYYRNLWLSRPIQNKKNIYFLNLTQSKFITNKLIKAGDIAIDNKRALSDYNTYIKVVK